jgi:hypothetical protein
LSLTWDGLAADRKAHCTNAVEWTWACSSILCIESLGKTNGFFPEKQLAQLSRETLLSQTLATLTETGLSSGIGIARGRRRQGKRSPFSVFRPYLVGVVTGFVFAAVIRSLIYDNSPQTMLGNFENEGKKKTLHGGTHHKSTPSGN